MKIYSNFPGMIFVIYEYFYVKNKNKILLGKEQKNKDSVLIDRSDQVVFLVVAT